MSAYPGRPTAKPPGDVAGTLWLLAYLALAIALMVLDHRGGWLAQVRQQGEVMMQPVWWLAGLPGRVGDSARSTARTQSSLSEENRQLRNALLVGNARIARLQAAAAENTRIRNLLGAAQQGRLDVQLVPILDIDLDPGRQRLVLAGGGGDGVRMGQAVIDAGGLLGQVISVRPTNSTVLLLTDPDHAVPVEIARNGMRLVAYGNGRSDQLVLSNIPQSADVKVGDAVVTSGLGGRFPAGFAVGKVSALRPDESRAFLVGEVEPAARLDRGREVLLLRSLRRQPMRAAFSGPGTNAAGDSVDGAAQAPVPTAFGVDIMRPPPPGADPASTAP